MKSLTVAGMALQMTMQYAADKSRRFANIIMESLPKVVGLATDAFSSLRGAVLAAGESAASGLETAATVGKIMQYGASSAVELTQSTTQWQLEVAETTYDIQKQVKAMEELIRQEPGLRLELQSLGEAINQAGGQYLAVLAKGQRLLEERCDFRRRAAAQTQQSRYQDMTFRIFRNDALQKYRAAFDLAARYVFLAAAAYDYEVNLLGTDSRSGRDFLTDIIRQRNLGQVVNDQPLAGQPGLADPLARLTQNFDVLKSQLGFNNPQTETGRFSVRSELYRINRGQAGTTNVLGAVSAASWKEALQKCRVNDLWAVPEFCRYCRPFAPESAGAQPGLVIRFPTTVTFGLNFFGWPLGGSDSAYDPSRFATKVRSVGVWFCGYDGAGLSLTPRVYLVPVGMDVLRSPTGNAGVVRYWKVLDQQLPVPFQIGASALKDPTWIPANDSVSGDFIAIRRFAGFRAYHDSGYWTAAEMTTDSRLIGRSVWNTDWLLIIPGGTLLYDANAGLDTFINSVTDIRLFFQTYSYAGN
jgi:hypothetical protein